MFLSIKQRKGAKEGGLAGVQRLHNSKPRAQERARKDIERAFGALKKRWGILQRGARSTNRDKVARIMYACCILHNMILEDEGKAVCVYVPEENVVPNPPPIQPGSQESLAIRRALRNRTTHFRLRESLGLHLQTVDHVDLNEIPQEDAEEFMKNGFGRKSRRWLFFWDLALPTGGSPVVRTPTRCKFKDHFVCFGRSRTCMEQWYVHAHACMDMEASWNDSMGAKTVYGQLTPSGIEDRMVGEQVG
ncbi:hypothetical protein LXL04_030475 [Taraxacum kok-saghyz]